ncbi:MAG: hypothetical protein ACI8V2_005133, partial [Candidatus Latescibacterota bacterium]
MFGQSRYELIQEEVFYAKAIQSPGTVGSIAARNSKSCVFSGRF